MCFQVTPMTALKFAELAAKAGLPKGVVNILPGSGRTHTFSHWLPHQASYDSEVD